MTAFYDVLFIALLENPKFSYNRPEPHWGSSR